MVNVLTEAKERGTFDVVPNMNPQADGDHPAVADALKLIAQNYTDKNDKDERNQKIADVWKINFTLHEPNGPRRITPKKMAQAIMQTVAKMKPHDFVMHGVQAQPWEENIATAGVATVLKKGGYGSSFRDKNGVAMNLLNYGDGFRLIGARREGGFPVEFSSLPNSNIYVNTQATAMRRGSNPVTKAAVVFEGNWDQLIALYPEAEKLASIGPIPRDTNYTKQINKSWVQKITDYKDRVEWCHYFDIEHNVYCLFVGSACSIIDIKVGDDYPFTMRNSYKEEEAFIPISQYMCFPAMEGFYNSGFGDLLYDLSMLYQETLNQFAQSVADNVNPIELVNLPNDEEMKFFQKLQMAYQERALGRRAMIPISYGAGSGNQVSIQPFATQALANEVTALWDRIDSEFRRFGIYLDEAEQAQTATETLSQIERANQLVRQIMEFNASEAEFELNAALSMTREFVKGSDSTPLNLTTMVDYPNPQTGEMEKLRPDFFTLGMFKKGLGKRHWFFNINDRSGVVPSQALKRAQLMGIAGMLPPGPALEGVVRGIADIDGVDIAVSEPTTPEPAATPELPRGQETATPGEVARDEIRFRELSPA